MREFLERTKLAKLEESENGQLKQNCRNELRADFMDSLVVALNGLGLEAQMTVDGIGFELPNDELGSVPVVISPTIKAMAYSIDEAHKEYVAKELKKAETEAEKERLKAQKEAEKEATKQAKAKKNAK